MTVPTAFGAPGMPPRWTSSAKEGIGTDHPAKIRWSGDNWTSADFATTHDTGLGCWVTDLPTTELPQGSKITFAILFPEGWEEIDFEVEVQRPSLTAERITNTVS